MFARSAPVRPAVCAQSRRDRRRPRAAFRAWHLQDLGTAAEVGCVIRICGRSAQGEAERGRGPGGDSKRHHDDLSSAPNPFELDEELVERLILLGFESVSHCGLADGVELVDEHDRRRVLARLFEQLPDAAAPSRRTSRRRRRTCA